jgi:enamine deaminase RidA (YjgF/YER057c/UK114 family)
MRQIEKEYWQKYAPRLIEEPPASTFLQPVSLSKPSMLVEIEVIAVIPR